MNALSTFLSSKYPFYYKGKERFIFLGIIFLMSFGFNYFFEPFDTNFSEHKMSYFYIHLVHAFVSLFIFLILSFVLNLFDIKEENWTLKKELIFIAFLLFFIGIGQFLIRDLIYTNPNNWTINYLAEEILNAFLVGFLLACIIIPINQLLLFQKYSNQAILLNKKENPDSKIEEEVEQKEEKIEYQTEENFVKNTVSSPQSNPIIFIKTAIEQEDFELNINQFLYAKSEGNYVEIYTFNADKKEIKNVKRITLSNFSKQLSDFSFILQIHRSYLVNLKKVSEVNGNAQGYKLQLGNFMGSNVPVSRSYISAFQEKWSEFRP